MRYRITSLGLAAACLGFAAVPARADLKLCNNTPTVVQVAIGYKDKDGWASEGWWTVKPTTCSGILKGALIARYYYIYAVDEKKVGAWGGPAKLCTKDKIFTIRGIEKCVERGYLQKGFHEVDTGEKSDWTITLSGAPTSIEAPAAADPQKPVAPAPDAPKAAAPDAPKTP